MSESGVGTGMFRFRIHFEHQDGTEDSFDVSGDSIEEIRKIAEQGLFDRKGHSAWSEELR